jgi:accessory colonization factor AcfC
VRKFIIGAVLTVLTVANAANAAEVVVFCPGAVQSVVRDIVKSYEQKTGNTV